MNAQLKAVLERQPGRLLDVGNRCRIPAGVARLVGVGLEQPRAARAERAVDGLLDRADSEEAVAVIDRLVLGEVPGKCLVANAQHHPQPVADRAFVDHLLHQIDVEPPFGQADRCCHE